MSVRLPDPDLLKQTGDFDYYHWNYQFPIKYIQRFRFNAILTLLGDKHYDRLLEIGTGSGLFLPELSHHCRQLYACDIHDMMDSVEQLCNFTGVNVNLKRCAIEHTDYPSNFFEAIVAVSVLEFVDDLELSMQEIRRILKPGGFFLTICPKQNKLIDFFLSFYTRRSPDEEFGDSRQKVGPSLEKHFILIKKEVFPPLLGRIVPVYVYYKLTK